MINLTTRLKRGIVIMTLGILVSIATPAFAQDQQNATQPPNQPVGAMPNLVLTLNLYDGIIKCPFPLWVKEPKQIGESKMYRHQKGNLFSVEMIPKAQAFSHWTRLYGIYGFYLPEHDMKRFFDESMNALALGCKAQGQAHILSTGDNAITLEYYCPELRPEVATDGNTVERGFMFISHTGKTYAKVYQAWRGGSNATESEDWPTHPNVEQEAVEKMKSIRFFKAEGK
ncbi:hypothetical protein [Humidesulfovibrio idahonensis]